MKKSFMKEYKAWHKKYPNPLDLEEIVENVWLVHKDKYYIRLQAMQDTTWGMAFVGVTIRERVNDDFEIVGLETEKIIEKEIKNIIVDLEKRTGIKYYE